MSHKRKDEHIFYAIKSGKMNRSVFEDIHVVYDSIPETDFSDVDTRINFLGKEFSFPIIINAITGGTNEGKNVNTALARAALEYDIPIAVGSQSIALKDKSSAETFSVVREINKKGCILANLGANATVDSAKQAVEMLDANGLQLHLNTLQELIMPEGDRVFKGILDNIKSIKDSVGVPVMVKEVGFGMSGNTAQRLRDAGIRTIDIGGYGGTNFARIEAMRRPDSMGKDLNTIGIPTAVSLYDVCRKKSGMEVICGGGIRSGLDIVKSLIMGADGVSIAYPFLEAYKSNGEKGVFECVERLVYEMKVCMIAVGACKIDELQTKDIIITGKTLEWVRQLK